MRLHVDLEPVDPGRHGDIAVGISGFGSARLSADRWKVLGELTGRKTFNLSWPSQVLPRMSGSPVSWASSSLVRFRMSQLASAMGVRFLVPWCERWLEQGRRVALVGFSMGGSIAIEVGRRVPGLEVMTICAAHGEDRLEGLERSRCLVHVYSRRDAALRLLVPVVTKSSAVGTVPLDARFRAVNVDVTETVGTDHMKASKMVGDLTKAGLELGWGLEPRWFGAEPGLVTPMNLRHPDPLMARWMQAAREGHGEAKQWEKTLTTRRIDLMSPGSSDAEIGRFRLAMSRRGCTPDQVCRSSPDDEVQLPGRG